MRVCVWVCVRACVCVGVGVCVCVCVCERHYEYDLGANGVAAQKGLKTFSTFLFASL